MFFKVEVIDQLVVVSDESNETELEFPLIWLRDNCQCEECFDPQTYTRLIDWDNFDFNMQLKAAEFIGGKLSVVWSDDHRSSFESSWLLKRNFSHQNTRNYIDQVYQPLKLVWGKNDFNAIFKSFDYNKVLSDDETLLQWLEALSVRGIALLKNTPPNEDEIYKLTERVAFIRKTHFGEHFVVKKKQETSTFAYTEATLQLHTDIPYYDHMPSVNLLHCLVQSKSHGGMNLITDGFYVAELMRREYFEYFDTLSTVCVNWCDVGNEMGKPYHYLLRKPVICLDDDGKVTRVNRSITQRDSFFSQNVADVQRWYLAMAKFVELLRAEATGFKMEESDFLTFDNTRLVHGRTSYTDSSGNARTLVGAYLDWDHIYSKMRVLKMAKEMIPMIQ